jgi:hypothetical protein
MQDLRQKHACEAWDKPCRRAKIYCNPDDVVVRGLYQDSEFH